jgi:hypothetical protein
MFLATYPLLNALNIMNLQTPQSAILSAVIFNALIFVALVPLALRGIRYRPVGAAALLRRNLMIYGVGGIIVPFIGIKTIDVVIRRLDWRDGADDAPPYGRRRAHMNLTRNLVVAVLMTVVTNGPVRHHLPARDYRHRASYLSRQGQRPIDRARRTGGRLAHHRPGLLVAGLLQTPAVGGRHGVRRCQLRGQ